MPIAILAALLPALSFYLYVLVQFMKEASRRRNHDTCALIVPLHSEGPRHANHSVRELRPKRTNELRNSPPASAPAASGSGDAASERAKVIVTQLKTRLAAYSSGTGRLAVDRAAKG
jgi:hypothetical protein